MPASETLDHVSTSMGEAPTVSQRHASIRITRRDDRSSLTRLVQFISSHFRQYMGRPDKEHPEGSVKIKPTKVVLKTCAVSERTVCGTHIYDVVPRSLRGKEKNVRKRIYYFCGGGWQSPPSPQHWQLCAKLARQMPETVISIVSYPLAPKNAAPVAFPWLLKLYRRLLQDAEEEDVKLILAGDSSGGNIVLSLVLEALREDEATEGPVEEDDKHTAHPVAVMAISPSTDLTRSNPDIEKIASIDPILTPDFVKSTAQAWKGDWKATDSRISPINADVSLLAKHGIHVHGVTGGFDILAPDAIAFRNMLERARVSGEWLEWDKQMHCFVLTWPYGLRESREGVGWIIDVLKKE